MPLFSEQIEAYLRDTAGLVAGYPNKVNIAIKHITGFLFVCFPVHIIFILH